VTARTTKQFLQTGYSGQRDLKVANQVIDTGDDHAPAYTTPRDTTIERINEGFDLMHERKTGT
jgi:hypothetical protein